MKVDFKTILWFAGIVAIISLIPAGILFYQNQRLKGNINTIESQMNLEYEQLTKSIQRAETKRVEGRRELLSFAEQNGLEIRTIARDQRKLGATLEAIAVSSAKTTTVVKNYYQSDSSTPSKEKTPTCKETGEAIDLHGYTKREESINLRDSNGMKIATTSFSAAKRNPWKSKIYGINYKILNSVSKTKTGELVLHTELVASSEAEPEKRFQIEGIDSRLLQAPEPGPSFSLWDPALYLMAQLSLVVYKEIDFSASLSFGVTVWSYGNDWRFVGLSAGYDAFQNTFRGSFIPIMYNLGSPLPLLSDFYLFLELGLDHRLNISVGLGIGTRI